MRYSNNHQIYLVFEEIIIFDKKKIWKMEYDRQCTVPCSQITDLIRTCFCFPK